MGVKISRRLQDAVFLWQEKYAELRVRWLEPENLHIALIPPWYVDEEELVEAIRQAGAAVRGIVPFRIQFERVRYGPGGKTPRLIWAEASASHEFSVLKKNVEDALFLPAGASKSRKAGPAHITLARINAFDPSFPPIDEKVHWVSEVEAIQFFESELTAKGAFYTVLETIPLE